MTWKIGRAPRSGPTPTPAPSSPQWRRIATALAACPGDDDPIIARRLRIARAHVAHVRAELARVAPAPPAPVQLLAPDVPAAGDDAPPRPRITPRPVAVCANCEREGTPSPAHPGWCKACAAGGHEVRAGWAPPPRSSTTEAALCLLRRTTDPGQKVLLRRFYLRSRAAELGLLEERHAKP